MLRLDGYTISSCIHESPRSQVYSGVRDLDGLRVVLKRYRGDRDDRLLRAQRELDALSRIDSPGVARALELHSAPDCHVLVMERFRGAPLSRYAQRGRFSVAEILSIALGIAQSLAAVHDARVIHKDVKPGNVLLDPETLATCLIDFGISAEFGRAERSSPPEGAEGTLRYIAPEQTGRMGRGVDFRSDLYALGASLYELLTGLPLFGPKAGIELMNAHIAVRPRAAAEVASRVPLAVSRIVEKLVEKDPEQRYQTARGLAADLAECRKQLETHGEIDADLALGQHDASDRLRFPSRLYGREREAAALSAAFDRVARGAAEVVLLAGPAGIGKSSLPEQLRERLAAANGYLAEAKLDFDLRERPYHGFAGALGSFVDQILTESRDRVEAWGRVIRDGLGPLGRVLVGVVPYLEVVVPDFPPIHGMDSHEAGERLALAAERLIKAIAHPDHPLVLFLDDLQWADAGTLLILRALHRANPPEALLLIGGYRSDEVGPDHPLAQLIEELESSAWPLQRMELEPLRLEDTTRLLADTLGRPPEETASLARSIGLKTQHNPLLVRRLLFHLWDRDLIRYEYGRGWTWDERRLAEAEITDDAAAMVASRIDSLPDRPRQLLEIAAAVGSVFELEQLVALADIVPAAALRELMLLVDQGLIAPCRNGFKFAHDRIREASLDRLSTEARERLHYRAATLLYERLPPDALAARIFEVADHFFRAAARIPEEMRLPVLDVAEQAGAAALRSGAPASAAHYLSFARDLVRPEDWRSTPDRVAALYLLGSRCAYQMREFERGLELLAALDDLEISPERRLRVDVQRLQLVTACRPTQETVDLSLATLRRYGVRWSRRPWTLRVRWAIWRTDLMLRGPHERWRLHPATSWHTSWMGPILIKGAAAQAHTLTSVRLVCLTGLDTVRAYWKHGYVRPPGLALATYAAWRASVLRHSRGLERYVRAAAAWNERMPDPVFGPKARYVLEAFANVWIRPRRSVLGPLAQIADELRNIGEVEYATNALYWRCIPLSLSGVHLEETVQELRALPRWLGMDPPAQATCLVEPFERLLAATESDTDAALARVEQLLSQFAGSSACPPLVTSWLVYLCVLGRFADALRLSEPIHQLVFEVHSTPHVADYTLLRGLSAAAVAFGAAAPERRRLLRVVRAARRQLEVWAAHGPDFVHMAELLRAELAASNGRIGVALRLYVSAAKRAADVEYPHHAALAHERRARLLARQRRPTDAEKDLGAALALYRAWGARAKVSQLETRDRQSPT